MNIAEILSFLSKIVNCFIIEKGTGVGLWSFPLPLILVTNLLSLYRTVTIFRVGEGWVRVGVGGMG